MKGLLTSEIEDIRDKTLFDAFHNEGHALERHILSDDALRRALWQKPRPCNNDDIVMVTRFFNEDVARNLIADALLANLDGIVEWLKSGSDEDYVACHTFSEPTGDGLAKNTDWSHTIPVHGIRIILKKDTRTAYRHFLVKTAYPVRSYEDVDYIYDIIDKYLASKGR